MRRTEMDDLERRFNGAMVSIYETVKRELGYDATRFVQMISEQGGLTTARQLLWSDGLTGQVDDGEAMVASYDSAFRRPSASWRGGSVRSTVGPTA